MTRKPTAVAAAVLLVIAAAALVLLPRVGAPPVPGPRPAAERPPLMLLTTLPLIFPERFTLRAPASPALKALKSRYSVVPISVADSGELDHRQLLLMAQPQAQPPEALVDLDQWVRGGGRVLLLADPALEWPSERPLGDILRPPFTFADTGLLAHWGLQLEAPERLGPATRVVDGRRIETESPGTLVATGRACTVSAEGFIAQCKLGMGFATVVADADFLDPDSRKSETANLGFLLVELERLESLPF